MKTEQIVRWIDAGEVSALRSQSVYHALAYARNKKSLDTVVLLRPADPYVCIGCHQNPFNELAIEECRALGLPIIRRETGGGTVFIDNMQLFVQWVFAPEHLPRRVDTRFQYFIQPLVEAHNQLGVKAHFHPPNDVHVKGKKLVGTGAGTIGNAEVVTGNFLLDFDYQKMVSILKTPGDCFRNMFADSLSRYLTTLQKEMGIAPDFEAIKSAYLSSCETLLKRPLVKGSFTEEELLWVERIERKFETEEWIFQDNKAENRPQKRLVKVHADVWVGQCSWSSKEGKNLVAVVRLKGKRIDAISFCGTLSMNPTHKLLAFEKMLKHVPFDKISIEEAARIFFELHEVKSELEPGEFAKAITELRKVNPTTPFSD